MTRVDRGEYRPCGACEAPWTEPIPVDWTVTVIGLYGMGQLVTPHRGGCKYGYQEVLIPDDAD